MSDYADFQQKRGRAIDIIDEDKVNWLRFEARIARRNDPEQANEYEQRAEEIENNIRDKQEA